MFQTSRVLMLKNVWYLALAAFAAVGVLTTQGIPFLAVSLTFALLATTVYVPKQNKTIFIHLVYIAILVLSFFVMYRANLFLTLLNVVAILMSGAFLIRFAPKKNSFGLLDVVISPFVSTYHSLFGTEHSYNFNSLWHQVSRTSSRKINWDSILPSIALSVVVLVIIVPLLASANPIFNTWISSVVNFIDFPKLFNLEAEDLYLWLWRGVVFVMLAYLIPRLVVFANSSTRYLESSVVKSFSLFLPQVLVALVVGIFFVSQAQLYFASTDMLRALGYTNSEQTREIFTQLSIVGLIILSLAYYNRSRTKTAQVLTYVLLIETFFLTLIALKSVVDYSMLWGLTYKRLWGFTVVAWITATLASFSFWYHQKLANHVFVKSVLIASAGILITVNVLNFDKLIYMYPPSEVKGVVDTEYLTRLSADARSYQEQAVHAQEITPWTSSSEVLGVHLSSVSYLNWNIVNLQEKYRELDWRTFNVGEYLQYRLIKDLNLSAYLQQLSTTLNMMSRVERAESNVSQPE